MKLKLAIGILAPVFSVSAMADNHFMAGGLNHSSTEWQNEAYSSAAPAYIGKHSTVSGSNGKVSDVLAKPEQGPMGKTISTTNINTKRRMGTL